MIAEMGGSDSTWATVSVWDEAAFAYVDLVSHVRGEDARGAYLAFHSPPMVIVRNIRYGLEPPIYPTTKRLKPAMCEFGHPRPPGSSRDTGDCPVCQARREQAHASLDRRDKLIADVEAFHEATVAP